MITGITKSSPFGVDVTHHKIKIFKVNKDTKEIVCEVYSYPSDTIAGTAATPLIATKVYLAMDTIPTSLKNSINSVRDLLEAEIVKLPDFLGGTVS